MDFYGVMGNPVEHSRSPWIHARFAQLTGESLCYERHLVPLGGFAQAVQDFVAQGGCGCNVTVPFKLEAAALANQRSERVLLAGAANTLTFRDGLIVADNTDGLGLVADLTHNAGVSLVGRDVLLIGAGGAAAGALGPLIAASPRRIVVANRTLVRAQALVAAHTPLAAMHRTELLATTPKEVDTDFDVVINASASSLAGDSVPVAASVLRSGCLAYDMMYGVAAQGFLDWACLHGAQARDGLGMLVEQAAEAFAIWRGVRPPGAQVLVELRALLSAPPTVG